MNLSCFGFKKFRRIDKFSSVSDDNFQINHLIVSDFV